MSNKEKGAHDRANPSLQGNESLQCWLVRGWYESSSKCIEFPRLISLPQLLALSANASGFHPSPRAAISRLFHFARTSRMRSWLQWRVGGWKLLVKLMRWETRKGDHACPDWGTSLKSLDRDVYLYQMDTLSFYYISMVNLSSNTKRL